MNRSLQCLNKWSIPVKIGTEEIQLGACCTVWIGFLIFFVGHIKIYYVCD